MPRVKTKLKGRGRERGQPPSRSSTDEEEDARPAGVEEQPHAQASNGSDTEGLADVVQPAADESVAAKPKRKSKKSCRMKDEEEEALVIEWVEANPILWNSKDKEFKLKAKKDRMWTEKAEELGYGGKFECAYFLIKW